MSQDQFEIELHDLNRRKTVERELDNFLNECLKQDVEIKSHQEATVELLKRYMSAVRSRNNVRRNWHPQNALVCDQLTLEWTSKDEFRKIAEKKFQDALVVTTNGSKVILEDAIKELVRQLTDEIYKSKRGSKKSSLEEIVRRILKSNPSATSTDVINEMRSRPQEYGIFAIDDTHVVIKVAQGIGKQTIDKPRSLASIKNIVSRIKTTMIYRD